MLIMPISLNMAQIQGTDTLYRPSDLVYFSALEMESFNRFFDGRPDYFSMLIAVNPDSKENEPGLYENWIAELVARIRDKKFDRLPEAKKINRIKNEVSKSFLIQFEHPASFRDLFTKGSYNYFTAASLYALLLDRLGIPCEIREVRNSILILAFPRQEKIPIEIEGTDTPFFMLAHDTRNHFVEFLREINVVDDATFTVTTSRALFDRYYFADYGLTIREMAGMLYLNSAIDFLNRSEAAKAYSQMEKAFILYPSRKTQYLLLANLNGFLGDMDYYNPIDLGYLIKASRLTGYGMKREKIERILKQIIHTVLIEAQDLKGMEYIYEYMQEFLADKELRTEFSFLYHYETARFHFNEQQYSKALAFSEQAYQLKPQNTNIQNLFASALAGFGITASSRLVLDRIEQYDTLYTELSGNEIYTTIKQHACLIFFGEAFQLQDRKNGEHYMALFEEITRAHPEINLDYIAVGRSYSAAGIYYYRQGEVQRSREILEKGLTLAPHNIELKLKLKSFE
jgi:tetratricopeptide (TPR) repeat protein